MNRVTVIVPTKDSARTLAACLDSVRSQSYPDVELIVVDNRSTDATPHIAAALADKVEEWGPERSAQRNRGASVAAGDILLFVDSDMVLEPDVVREVVAAFDADPGVGAVVVPERAFGEGMWAACRVLEKELYLGDADVEAARAFRRSLFDAVGGYDENLTGAEDWDLPDRIGATGRRMARTTALIWHDEGRISLRRSFGKKRYYGRGVGRWIRDRDDTACPRRLARPSMFSQPRLLARSPACAAGLIVLKAVEWAGIVTGVLEERRAART